MAEAQKAVLLALIDILRERGLLEESTFADAKSRVHSAEIPELFQLFEEVKPSDGYMQSTF